MCPQNEKFVTKLYFNSQNKKYFTVKELSFLILFVLYFIFLNSNFKTFFNNYYHI